MRKLISLVLVLATLLSLGTVAFAATSFENTDYTHKDWYFRYVEKAVSNGWMNGVGNQNFNPNGTLNRAMFVTILHRIAGTPSPTKAAVFSDVVKGSWYENAVSWAAENGVVTGYADGRFGVTDPLTREQMATILFRWAGKQGKNVSGRGDLTAFTDRASISSYAADAFAWAVNAGVITGANNALSPKGTSTRAQAATVLCRFDAAEESATLTRADLEKAVVELAWAYSLKDTAIQYDSQNMTQDILNKYFSGTYRVTEDAAPEFGIDDTAIFSVCSDYVQKTYYNALNERFMGFPLDWVTVCLWNNTENIYNGKDIVKVRYWDDKNVSGRRASSILKTTTHRISPQEMREFFINWKTTMRPGDVLVPDGHAMLYIGDGYVLDCAGGKYDLSTGVDTYESKGAVSKLRTVMGCYVDGTEQSGGWAFPTEGNSKTPTFVVLRPLDAICIDDGDSDPGNDKAIDATAIPAATRTRMQYPGMDIRHSADIGSLGSAVSGGNVTYTVDIYNKTNDSKYLTYRQYDEAGYIGQDYKGLVVTEVIPEGTELVAGSITEGGVYADGKIKWTVDVAAGSVKSLKYTVKVNTPVGGTIVNEGGFVGNIPAKVLTNFVGGKKLTAEDNAVLAEFYNQYGQDWVQTYGIELTDNTSAAEEVYSKVLGKKLELPTVQELFDSIYEQVHVDQRVSVGYMRGETREAWLYTPKADVYKTNPMLVRNYLGGQGTWFEDDQDRVNEFHATYLEPGDIVFHVNLSKYNGSAKRTVTDAKIMIWLGNDQYAVYDTATKSFTRDEGTKEQWMAYLYDAFFVLRPTQGENMQDSGKKVTPMSIADAEAASRAKYPGIQVERNSSLGAYHTVVKGGEVTFTVSVKNGSSTPYTGLTIMENVYAGTEVIKAEGAKQDSGRLIWTVDVPAGKTTSVSYTIKVTDKADKTIDAAGKVDNIPTKTQVIGISKNLITSKVQERLDKLAAMTGEEVLSTLKMTGKRSLDQIRIIYSWILTGKASIHSKMSSGIKGLGETRNYYQSGGKDASGLYSMPESGALAIDSTRVDGFWGGSEVHHEGSLVYTNKPTMDDLMNGDILVQYDGEGVIYNLYLGGGKFLSMYTGNPNGTAPTLGGAEVLDSCFTEEVKFFMLLRLSKMYSLKDVTG